MIIQMDNVLLWTPTHRCTNVDCPASIYLHQLCADTGFHLEDLPGGMNDNDEWRERKRESQENLCCLHDLMIIHHIFFFIIQRVKARAIPCPHQPPSRGDNTVSVAQGGTATPGATKQLLPPDRVFKRIIYIYIYIYIYTPDQLDAETTLDVNLHFLSAVCDLKIYIYIISLDSTLSSWKALF